MIRLTIFYSIVILLMMLLIQHRLTILKTVLAIGASIVLAYATKKPEAKPRAKVR